jgi:hypothetical protein
LWQLLLYIRGWLQRTPASWADSEYGLTCSSSFGTGCSNSFMTIVSFPLTWCIPLYPFQQGLNLALGGSGLGVGATLSKFVSSLHSLPQLDDCGGSLYLPFLYSLKNYFYSYILIIQSEGFHHDASYMYIMYFDHIFPLYYSLWFPSPHHSYII